MTRHHEDKAKHMGGQVADVSLETRAHLYFTQGFGDGEIALKLLGKSDDNTRAEVRGLIAAGRKKALGAH